ncbi:unnamed protein product [Rhizoctonia solani]|uniref:Uncharacterized protein n=1 Tax=Rhizoctonia solani TaxID=456999 RepID=A0A8H3B8W8_9AGAM|nr:unnamed protein product [Rhizoctonia solani]
MAPQPRAHPVWGRPIDDYVASYDLAAAQKRKAVTRKGEAEAVDAIRSVSRLARQTRATPSENVTIQTLETILQLTLSPRTFHHFAHPPLVSGCIALLSEVKPEGRPSPFSYEFGYLGFKILTLAVGACILQRSNNLDGMTSRMAFELDTGPLLIFSDSVAQAVNARIQLGMVGGPCDWVLDWVEGMGSQRGAIVPQSDVHTLLILLWEDRELFLKAFAGTYTPGPSGILFLLWRHLHFERVFDSQPPSKLAAPFCEILWRYMLVFTRDQGDTLILLQKHLQACSATDVWDLSPKTVTLSDLKNLIQLYSDRLPMSHSEISPSLNIGVIPILLKFVSHLAGERPGAEESYPLLVERTLERVCDTLTLETERDDFEARLGHAQALFSFLALLFEHMENNQTYNHSQAGQRAVLGVLKALKRLGILDLIIRMFLMLKSTSDARMDYRVSSAFMLQVASTIIRKIAAIAPKYIIDSTFKYYIPDWIKFHEHLLYLVNGAPTTSDPLTAHLESCCRVWRELAETLGIYYQIDIALSNPLSCSYVRCANPTARNGAQDPLVCGTGRMAGD